MWEIDFWILDDVVIEVDGICGDALSEVFFPWVVGKMWHVPGRINNFQILITSLN
jgi:hypothetical protein